jgi:flap endonuclease-1
MGIKRLLKLLMETTNVVKNTSIEQYKYKKIAIDISLMMYKIIITIRNSGADYTNHKGEISSHILGLFNKTVSFLKNGIIPIYVFDGKPPDIKNKTLTSRKNTKTKNLEKMKNSNTDEDRIKYFKKCVSITKKQWNECKELLNIMGIPWINAPEEADSQCAYLSKEKIVDAVLTDDMDILTFGSSKIVKNLSSKKNYTTEINLDDVLKTLNLSLDEFIEFCILLGSDYDDGLSNIKQNIILEYYTKYKNIEDTINAMKKDNYSVKTFADSMDNYTIIKKYFTEPNITKITSEELKIKQPQCDVLLKVLVGEYGLINGLVKNKVYNLNKYYEELKNI